MSLRLVIPSRSDVDCEISVARPWWQFSVCFNVAIAHSIPIARMHEGESEGVIMPWGLAQKAAADRIIISKRGVVHSDTLQSSQALRTAWLNGQRGIVPLAGFYLWQRTPAGYYQPYYVRLVNRPVFGVAALWERVETGENDVVESCVLITVNANPLLAELDNDGGQMPGVLHRRDYDAWLSSSVPQAKELLKPYPQSRMVCHPVAPYVNRLEFDDPGLIKPISR